MSLSLRFFRAFVRWGISAKSQLIDERWMKPLYVFALLLLLSSTAGSQHNQGNDKTIVPQHHRAGDKSSILQRHGVCDNGIEVLGGTTQYGFAVQPGYVRGLSKRVFIKLSPFYSKEVDRGLFHFVTGFDAVAGFTVMNVDHKFFLSGLAGLGYSYEKGRWRRSDTDRYFQGKGSSIFGAEAEYYLNNRFSVVVMSNQHLVTDFKKVWGFHRWYVMGGLRYHFYRMHKCGPAPICPPASKGKGLFEPKNEPKKSNQ